MEQVLLETILRRWVITPRRMLKTQQPWEVTQLPLAYTLLLWVNLQLLQENIQQLWDMLVLQAEIILPL